MSYYFYKFFCMYHKQKNSLSTCFLRLIFLLTSLFSKSALNSIDPLQGLPLGLKVLFRMPISRFLQKKRNISQNNHSLSFVVTRCGTRCHLLYHSLSLDVLLVCLFINDLIQRRISDRNGKDNKNFYLLKQKISWSFKAQK